MAGPNEALEATAMFGTPRSVGQPLFQAIIFPESEEMWCEAGHLCSILAGLLSLSWGTAWRSPALRPAREK